ncbi:hypothetical protein MKZ38_007907 [Zalerion maritima]|uniref:MPN domain-containing protein n=1 Tax=Zalerion maritima TaxID=339359 RepID=A0AAD5RIB7_9PEZI|nr:hypothetical protein MKZ38_007907 [Zalerion maritima]
MDSRSSRGGSLGTGRPMTVPECVDQAKEYTFDVDIPLKIYVRSFRMIFKEANIYWGQGNLPQAYVLMYRASDLVLNQMGTHPESKSPEGKMMIKEITPQARQVIRDLEKLKPLVEAQNEEWERMAGQKKRHSDGYDDGSPPPKTRPGQGYSPTVLDPKDYNNDQVNEVLRNFSKRAAYRRGPTRRGSRTTASDYGEKRKGDVYDRYTVPVKQETDEDATRRQMEAARRQLDATDPNRFQQDGEGTPPASYSSYSSFTPSYPTLRPSKPIDLQPRATSPVTRPPFPPPITPLPPRPPKSPPRVLKTSPPRPRDITYPTKPFSPSFPGGFSQPPPPTRPEKAPFEPTPREAAQSAASPAPARPPKLTQETRPSTMALPLVSEDYVFKAADYLESGAPLRSLFIPSNLRRRFLERAEPNTRRNLETCGFLLGTIINNALFVTSLFIPQQTCTEDTCDTTNEEEMLTHCDENELLVFGWIHTHPTQTCFLSSRDLHTHMGHQLTLAESVAIVCSPRQPEYKYDIFRLTDPPGKQAILQCGRDGIFHPHDLPDRDLFRSAMGSGGHVRQLDDMQLSVTDKRKHQDNH